MKNSLKSISLRDGYTMVFQRDSKGNIRAVVKDRLGCICHCGPIVPESDSEASKLAVLREFIGEEDEEEEDEEEEDEEG